MNAAADFATFLVLENPSQDFLQSIDQLIFSDMRDKKLINRFENIFILSVKEPASALMVIFS